MKTLLFTFIIFLYPHVFSQAGQFEIVDVSGQISGELGSSSDDARTQWNKACQEWKTESKDLNKNNELIGMSCNNANCSFVESGKWQCVSTGTYKVKTAGVRAGHTNIAPPLPEPPTTMPLPPEHEIATAPPETIVEIVPQPRSGFLWVQGYWGWSGHRHLWYPGHWMHARPGYVWVGDRWSRHGRGWRFESGRWEMRH